MKNGVTHSLALSLFPVVHFSFLQPGLGVICCPVDQLVGKLSFRVQQLNVKVETKTLDNVFLVAVVSVQYQVLRDKVYDAFYALTNPAQQITAHVYDVMRSQLPTLELDAVFEAKEELALAVKNALGAIMTSYGYQIIQVLITDLDPDQRVKVCTKQKHAYISSVRVDCCLVYESWHAIFVSPITPLSILLPTTYYI